MLIFHFPVMGLELVPPAYIVNDFFKKNVSHVIFY